MVYTDTIRSVSTGRDSLPALALRDNAGNGYYLNFVWQYEGDIRYQTSNTPDSPATGTKPALSDTYNLSSSAAQSRHPAIAAGPDTVLVVWAEDTPARILAIAQVPGAAWNSWGSATNVSNSPDTACDYPTIALEDSTVVIYQKQQSTGNHDIIARVNYGTELNLSASSNESRYGHVVYELHDGTTPLLHAVWTEDLSVNHSEVGYKRWELGVTGGGGGGQSAGRIDPTIEPGLLAPAPNPFRDRTTIAYATNTTGPVRVRVYDALGREVRTLVNTKHQPGRYRTVWDRKDTRGRPMPRGVYFVRLDAPNCRQNRKLILVP